MKQNNQTYYYIYDCLGNVRYILDSSGAVFNSSTYSPSGQINSSSGSLSQPYQYVGGEFYYTEEDTGLKLLGQRWYDSELGRFISRDLISGTISLPLTLHLYLYSLNNPIRFRDPKGLSCCNYICKRWEPNWRLAGYNSWWDCTNDIANIPTIISWIIGLIGHKFIPQLGGGLIIGGGIAITIAGIWCGMDTCVEWECVDSGDLNYLPNPGGFF